MTCLIVLFGFSKKCERCYTRISSFSRPTPASSFTTSSPVIYLCWRSSATYDRQILAVPSRCWRFWPHASSSPSSATLMPTSVRPSITLPSSICCRIRRRIFSIEFVIFTVNEWAKRNAFSFLFSSMHFTIPRPWIDGSLRPIHWKRINSPLSPISLCWKKFAVWKHTGRSPSPAAEVMEVPAASPPLPTVFWSFMTRHCSKRGTGHRYASCRLSTNCSWSNCGATTAVRRRSRHSPSGHATPPKPFGNSPSKITRFSNSETCLRPSLRFEF